MLIAACLLVLTLELTALANFQFGRRIGKRLWYIFSVRVIASSQ